MPTPLPAIRVSGRHRKTRTPYPSLRRAALLALTAPVAGTVLLGPSAFAAEKTVTKTTTLDPAEQRIADKLNARIQDTRLGNSLSGVVIDADSGNTVWGQAATTALMPASNVKLATATAALKVLLIVSEWQPRPSLPHVRRGPVPSSSAIR